VGIIIKKFIVKAAYTTAEKIIVDFMIDSGAVYSLVPKTELKKLGIEPYKTMDFFLADGTKITRTVGDAYFEYDGEGGFAPVVFGEEGDEPLLGATALESCGLILNPYRRELYPMRMLML
jgi:aspartyl protease family protein